MAIERTYKCNLCGKVREPGGLIGIHFTSHFAASGVDWMTKSARECESHLCVACATEIRFGAQDRLKNLIPPGFDGK